MSTKPEFATGVLIYGFLCVLLPIMNRKTLILLSGLLLFAGCNSFTGTKTIHILSTNDVHGVWFDQPYINSGRQRASLFAINSYVDSLRTLYGENATLLLDSGDCLQGDNAAYFFNYVDTLSPHLFPRLVAYMKYDAITVGNHDIETGPKVYDRVREELDEHGIPFFAANALKPDGKPYFQEYKIFKKNGIKVLVFGATNANIQAWLDKSLWPNMEFVSLIPFVQNRIDEIKSHEKPDVVIVSVHSGTGLGDGSALENQGLDLLKSLKGVDVLLCAHDHNPKIVKGENSILVNSGSRAKNLGNTTVSVHFKNGKIVGKDIEAEMLHIDRNRTDIHMQEAFKKDYEKVKAFTLQEVGSIDEDLYTRDAFRGQSFYMDIIHKVQLEESGADISFSAPLSFNKKLSKGTLVYNDMFTLYPYENSLCVMNMTGKEVKDYLEYSYNQWIKNPSEDGHIFKMSPSKSERFDTASWSFDARSYNFDSAAGINYTVNITKPFGSRITITGMSDGRNFNENDTYSVAMTSYRAAGGGNLLFDGAGLKRDDLDKRLVTRMPEIRDMVYHYIYSNKVLTHKETGEGIGNWNFIPEKQAKKAIDSDMSLLFPKR